jgi:precorrin-6B methylase 2
MTMQQTVLSGADDAPPALTPEAILQVGLGFWGSKTLLSAVELGVFTQLGDGPLPGEELAARLGLHARSRWDFLDALVALGMLERADGAYRNTPHTALFLDRSSPSYIGGLLEMANARLYRDPERLKQFLHAMTGLSIGAHKAIAARFPWRRYRTFADVGCAEGGLPVELALAHEHLTGTGFDLPAARPHFDDYVASFGLQKRLRFQPGDFFADPLPAADVLVMGHILHDWGLEQKRTLLERAHAALPTGGALIAFDTVIDHDRRQNAFGLLMSLNMLIETSAGFDYTAADCQAWMRQAGFRETYLEHLAGPDSMIVAIK